MSKRKTVIGTPYWMAPEVEAPLPPLAPLTPQPSPRLPLTRTAVPSRCARGQVLQSQEYNGKADIWSLAITAIELAVGEPPHSNVHPMRAIFMIPNSEPPTLPDPHRWSAAFHDFVAQCCQKNPDRRPSALELLERHPFITGSKSKAVIAQLVDECMAEIEEYRQQEALEAEGGEESASTKGTAAFASMSTGSNTMFRNSTGTMIPSQSGTMVQGRPGAAEGAGTMMRRPGAAAQDEEESEEGAGDSGTMVTYPTGKRPAFASGTMVAGAGARASPGTLERKDEPSYMKHMRGEVATGTMKPSVKPAFNPNTATMIHGTPSASVQPLSAAASPASYASWYRSGKTLDAVGLRDTSSLAELNQALNGLSRAYEDERGELDSAYEEARQRIRQWIAAKQR